MRPGDIYDVVVVGAGPAGSTAALVMARAGLRVIVLEKDRFPRFHIGESFLPNSYTLLCELGLDQPLEKIPHVPKFGAEFGMGGGDQTTLYYFDTDLTGKNPRTFNIERAPFDAMLLDEARLSGAEVHEATAVNRILQLTDGDVRVDTDRGEVRGRYLVDASGQATVVGRHLGTRRMVVDPRLQKIAYFAHYDHVSRHVGADAGHPMVAMCDEGWFWLIPLNETRMSVGLVLNAQVAQGIDVPAKQMLSWGIARCPLVSGRMRNAVGPATNQVTADFTYTCKPYAGQGYFLVGDAATFVDPVFSTGVNLGMLSAKMAADAVVDLVNQRSTSAKTRRRHIKQLQDNTRLFFLIIRYFYDHSFRELVLQGQGPLQIHRAVIAILTGNASSRTPWAVLWRFRLFELFIRLQRYVPLAPRRSHFSLLRYLDPVSAPISAHHHAVEA